MENLKIFLCICMICSINLTDVSGRALQSNRQTRSIQDSNCGTLKLTKSGNSETVDLSLLEKNITSFRTHYDGYTISNLNIQPGFAFRLCNRISCEIFKATDVKEVPPKLTIVNSLLQSATCNRDNESNEIASCSTVSNQLQENECARYYRAKNCDNSFQYEPSNINQTRFFNNEVFESIAINKKCSVVLKFDDGLEPPLVHGVSYEEQNDLMSVYNKSQVKAYPKWIELTCRC